MSMAAVSLSGAKRQYETDQEIPPNSADADVCGKKRSNVSVSVGLTGDPSQLLFPVLSPDSYKVRKFPSFREPSEIGYFSLDGERRFQPDRHQLKYLCMPPFVLGLHMDLSSGYSTVIRKDQSVIERLDSMLHWILANRRRTQMSFPVKNPTQVFGADFVCYRGLLTTILCTPYESREDWIICATKFKGTIYLCAFHTEQRMRQEQNRTERDHLMSSWGYKFEQYMVSDSPTGKPNIDAPVNEKEEFCITLKGRLNDHVLLYSAETDAVDPKVKRTDDTTKCYVELKTSRIITTEKQDYNFCRLKLLKWWAQSFLIGIPKIICGFRDDNGIVRNLKSFHTKEIPKIAEGLWDPAAAMNFCDIFLTFVKNSVVKDDPNTVYKFYWRPGQSVVGEELTSPLEYQILPPWYISAFDTVT